MKKMYDRPNTEFVMYDVEDALNGSQTKGGDNKKISPKNLPEFDPKAWEEII